jgi:hypothetical protein
MNLLYTARTNNWYFWSTTLASLAHFRVSCLILNVCDTFYFEAGVPGAVFSVKPAHISGLLTWAARKLQEGTSQDRTWQRPTGDQAGGRGRPKTRVSLMMSRSSLGVY